MTSQVRKSNKTLKNQNYRFKNLLNPTSKKPQGITNNNNNSHYWHDKYLILSAYWHNKYLTQHGIIG